MTNQTMPSEGSTFDDLRENVTEVKDDMKEAIVDDKPLDKHAPGATFGLMFLSYLVALLLFLCIFGLIYWLFY